MKLKATRPKGAPLAIWDAYIEWIKAPAQIDLRYEVVESRTGELSTEISWPAFYAGFMAAVEVCKQQVDIAFFGEK